MREHGARIDVCVRGLGSLLRGRAVRRQGRVTLLGSQDILDHLGGGRTSGALGDFTVEGGHVGRETEGGVGFVGAERNHGVISNDGVRE